MRSRVRCADAARLRWSSALVGAAVWTTGCALPIGPDGPDGATGEPLSAGQPADWVEQNNPAGRYSADGLSILVDASRDGGVWWSPQREGEGGFDPELEHQGKWLADDLRSRGHQVDELGRPHSIGPDLLDGYDVVIRANHFGDYSENEVDAYRDYVGRGGGLLLLSDHMTYAPPDAVGAAFGIEFAGITRGEQRLDVLAPHPITEGVSALTYGVGSAIVRAPDEAQIVGHLTVSGYADLDLDGIQDPEDVVAPAVLATLTYGDGRVVASGDTNLWEWIPQPLVDNVIAWLGER